MNKLWSFFGQLFTDKITAYSYWCVHAYLCAHSWGGSPYLSTLQYFLRSYWCLCITENHLSSMVLDC